MIKKKKNILILGNHCLKPPLTVLSEGKEVTASVVEANETKNSPDVTTANPVPPIKEESPVSSVAGEASGKFATVFKDPETKAWKI